MLNGMIDWSLVTVIISSISNIIIISNSIIITEIIIIIMTNMFQHHYHYHDQHHYRYLDAGVVVPRVTLLLRQGWVDFQLYVTRQLDGKYYNEYNG